MFCLSQLTLSQLVFPCWQILCFPSKDSFVSMSNGNIQKHCISELDSVSQDIVAEPSVFCDLNVSEHYTDVYDFGVCEADQQASEIITSDFRSDFHVFTSVDYVAPGSKPASILFP